MNCLSRRCRLVGVFLTVLTAWAMPGSVARCQDPPWLILFFSGTLEPLNTTLVNPYTGESESINGTYNVSQTVWQGGGSEGDILLMTPLSDALFLTDTLGQQMVMDIESFSGSSENDLIILADDEIDYDVDTHIFGGGGDDLIWASIGDDTIDGGTGNDTLNGGPRDDVIYGGADNDKLNGASGIDELYGGDNNDFLYSSVDNTWDAFAAGQNRQFFTRSVGDPTNPVTNSPQVAVSGFRQSYDLFDGGDGGDILELTDGNDAIFLHDPHSPFSGDPNAPRIVDIEAIDGKGGDDIIDLTSPLLSYGDVILAGREGNDVLWSSSGDDALYGGVGNDHLDGNSGNDQLEGGDGDDILYGRSGNDFLDGGTGNDIIYLGEGVDVAFVDEGNDTLIYDHFDDLIDVIIGFETSGAGADVLDISNILTDYDPATDTIGDFAVFGINEGNTSLLVDTDGTTGGASFTEIVVFDSLFNATLADLIGSGALIVDPTVETIEPDADFDGNGSVSGEDFLAWQRGLGQSTGVTPESGDANRDGMVDATDLGIWQDQYGTVDIHGSTTPPPASAATVPEPTSAILLALTLPLCWILRKRRTP